MNRIQCFTKDGYYLGWYDAKKAQFWEEDSYFDGHNHISLNTGSQWDNQRLIKTVNQRFLLEEVSRSCGRGGYHRELDAEEAAEWLLKNGHTLSPDLEEYAERYAL